jgi:uncharacterized membrane protein
MFGRRKRVGALADAVSDISAHAGELVEDKKSRRRLGAAAAHALAAKRDARARGTLAQLATNRQLHGHLLAAVEQLKSANERAQSRRRRRRLLRFGLVLAPATALAVPQSRTWLRQRLSGPKQALGSVVPSTGAGRPRTIEEKIEVGVPVSTVYNQWTQFEEFPLFMEGVDDVRQLDDTNLHWVASIAGNRAEWDAKITEQTPDRTIAWVSTDGKDTRGRVEFESLGESRSRVKLTMTYTPVGVGQTIGSAAGLDARRVRGDLDRFKQLIESRGVEDGAWRGEVHGGSKTS